MHTDRALAMLPAAVPHSLSARHCARTAGRARRVVLQQLRPSRRSRSPGAAAITGRTRICVKFGRMRPDFNVLPYRLPLISYFLLRHQSRHLALPAINFIDLFSVLYWEKQQTELSRRKSPRTLVVRQQFTDASRKKGHPTM